MSGTRYFALRGASNDPVSDKRIGYAGLWTSAAVFGLLWGLGVFVVMSAFMGFDYFAVRGAPTEKVTIVSVEPSGTMEFCGRRALRADTPGERTTYQSANPPPGLPAEFSITHCPWEQTPGATRQVRRTGTSADDFHPDPIDSPVSWLGTAALFGLGAALAMMVVGLANGVWEARSERKAEARHLEPAASADRANPSGERPDSEEDLWPLQHPR